MAGLSARYNSISASALASSRMKATSSRIAAITLAPRTLRKLPALTSMRVRFANSMLSAVSPVTILASMGTAATSARMYENTTLACVLSTAITMSTPVSPGASR